MVSEDIRRSRGILTEPDREFLSDRDKREEMTSGGRSQRWSDIRDRIQNGMLDFIWIVQNLPPEQRRRIFEDGWLVDNSDPREIERAFAYPIAFAYQQLQDTERLESAVKIGVERAELTNGNVVNTNVFIKTALNYYVADIKRRFAEEGLGAVELGEINILWHADEIDNHEATVLKLEKQSPSGDDEFIQEVQEDLEPEGGDGS